jgi:hypothetical protein
MGVSARRCISIDTSGTGEQTVLAAVAGVSVRVWAYNLTLSGTVSLTTFKFNILGSTDLTGAMGHNVIASLYQSSMPVGDGPLFISTPGTGMAITVAGGTTPLLKGFVIVDQVS